jgi:hypothetical protein
MSEKLYNYKIFISHFESGADSAFKYYMKDDIEFPKDWGNGSEPWKRGWKHGINIGVAQKYYNQQKRWERHGVKCYGGYGYEC